MVEIYGMASCTVDWAKILKITYDRHMYKDHPLLLFLETKGRFDWGGYIQTFE